MRSFGEGFTIARFRQLVAMVGGPERGGYFDGVTTLVEPALRDFLRGRQAAGLIKPVPNHDGHRTPFGDAWNRIAEPSGPKDVERAWSEITPTLARAAMGHRCHVASALSQSDGPESVGAIEKAYGDLVADVDAGRIHVRDIPRQQCQLTGEDYTVRIDGWQPTFWTVPGKGASVPMQPVAPRMVREVEVTFETGELLVCDWPRVEGFAEVVEADRTESLGSLAGCEAMTERHARHGFVSVHVGNTSPGVFRRDGVLAFGRGGAGDEIGSVTTDRWGVVAIDRARLVSLVAARHGQERALVLVEEFVATEEPLTVTVEPGTHWIYMHGEPGDFGSMFTPPDVDFDGVEPLFVLSPRKLDLEAAPSSPSP
jgi:hypothetical protein